MKRLVSLLALATVLLTACSEEQPSVAPLASTPGPVNACPNTGVTNPVEGDAGVEVDGAKDEEPAITLPQTAEQACTFFFKDLEVGDGDEVPEGATVEAHYVGMSWKTKKVFDSTWGGDPSQFPLDQVIPGWKTGIPGMKEGGRRLLVIPPEVGYGPSPRPLAPYDTLVFVVDVLEVL